MENLQFHELANLYPLDEDTIEELADDIRKTGQIEPIMLYDGKIIDGRRRYKACLLAGVKPTYETVNPEDPIAFVVSLNSMRRHLTPSQKAMVADKVRAMYDEAAKERQKLSEGRGKKGVVSLPHLNEKARDTAGKAVGVSGTLVDRARTVREKGVPELAQAVERGRMSVTRAADLTEEDEETQRKEAESAEFSGGRYRRKTKIDAEPELTEIKSRGVGIRLANEAVNVLQKIPKDDPARADGFRIVLNYIKMNK